MQATQQQRQSTPITSFLFGVLIIVMIIAFGSLAAAQLGYTFNGAAQQPIPQPTPIIRVVAPQPQQVAPAPIQAAPAPVVAPEPAQPAVAVPQEGQAQTVENATCYGYSTSDGTHVPDMASERPCSAPPVAEAQAPPRTIVVIKNGADQAAPPVVIDRGTKRRSP